MHDLLKEIVPLTLKVVYQFILTMNNVSKLPLLKDFQKFNQSAGNSRIFYDVSVNDLIILLVLSGQYPIFQHLCEKSWLMYAHN